MSKQTGTRKHRQLNSLGYTLAELLMVTGIIAVLAAVSIVAVITYQKQLKLTEMDATAKEVFVAAQNHMTALKASGEWDSYATDHIADDKPDPSFFGTKIEEKNKQSDYPDEDSKFGEWSDHTFYYLIVNPDSESGDISNPLDTSILSGFLPFGSIDETIRSDGSYVIEYDYDTATVYGVFYTDSKDKMSYSKDVAELNKAADGKNGRTEKEARKKYKRDGESVVIGYYGGAMAKKLTTKELLAPTLTIENDDKLVLTITDSNLESQNDKIVVEITGEESGNTIVCPLNIKNSEKDSTSANSGQKWWDSWVYSSGVYTFTLDDITLEKGHFNDLFCSNAGTEPNLIPGENIAIRVSCTSSKVLAATQYAQGRTNSLFANVTPALAADQSTDANAPIYMVAEVNCVRHLQNLSYDISTLKMNGTSKNDNVVTQVQQTGNIEWDIFASGSSVQIFDNGGNGIGENLFRGISNNALSTYKGNNFSVKGLTIQGESDSNVGLFAEIGDVSLAGVQAGTQTLTVDHLILDSFQVSATGTGNVGTFLGSTKEKSQLKTNHLFVSNSKITSVSGEAGSVAGHIQGGTIDESGAYLTSDDSTTAENKYLSNEYGVITKSGNAGGLIGNAQTLSYNEKKNVNYGTVISESFASVPVTTETGNIGGLIGVLEGETGKEDEENVIAKIVNSYSGGYCANGTYSEDNCNLKQLNDTTNAAGGLIGAAQKKVYILNAYSTCSISGDLVGGLAGTISNQTDISNAYSTGKVMAVSEDSVVGTFIGEAQEKKYEHCYVKDSNSETIYPIGSINKKIDIQRVSQEELSDSEKTIFSANETYGAPAWKSDVETHPYGMSATLRYPYPTVNATGANDTTKQAAHYGDWSYQVKITGVGLVYYELIPYDSGNGATSYHTYYHGYEGTFSNDGMSAQNYREIMTQGAGLVNGLVRDGDKYVSQEGYAVLLPTGMDPEELEHVWFGGYKTYQVSTKLEPNTTIQIPGCDVYIFKDNNIENDYFTSKRENAEMSFCYAQKNEWGQYPVYNVSDIKNYTYCTFYMNSFMGDSIHAGTISETDKEIFYIRSVRQLKNLFSDNWSWNDSNSKYYQTIDINLTGTEQNYTAQNFKGYYKAESIPGNSRNYQILGLQSQLLVQNNGGTLDGIRLVNPQVSGNYNSILVGTNQSGSSILNCSIISDPNLPGGDTGAWITNPSGNAAGVVGTNNGGIIADCSFRGTVKSSSGDAVGFCYSNSGTIRNIIVEPAEDNGTVAEGVNNTTGFCYENSGTIEKAVVLGAVKSNSDAVGFCYKNSGTLRSDEVRPKEALAKSYDSVSITGKNQAVGFVYENSWDKEISDCLVTATVTSSNGDAAGFCYTNGGLIHNSYSNSIVSAHDNATGFLMVNGSGRTIDRCASLLSVEGNGAAYGFSGSGVGNYSNCYSAMNEIRGDQIYYFAPLDSNGTAIQCYYLNLVKVVAANVADNQSKAEAIAYANLSNKMELGTRVSAENTHSYHMPTAYPFPIAVSEGKTPVFWGDWPIEPTTYDYAWLNYEDYSGMRRYNNGNPQPIYGTGDNSEDTYGIWGTLVKVNGIWDEQIEAIDTTALFPHGIGYTQASHMLIADMVLQCRVVLHQEV